MNWLISPAHAQTGGGAAPGGGGIELIMLVVMVVVFYFFLIRPQQKRAKEHKNLVQSLNKGDEVITSGGIVGRVTKVTDDFVVLEISNNLEIKLQKQSVRPRCPRAPSNQSEVTPYDPLSALEILPAPGRAVGVRSLCPAQRLSGRARHPDQRR